MRILIEVLSLAAAELKSLDASGGSASRNLLGAAKGDLIRAAASTQPLCACPFAETPLLNSASFNIVVP